MKRLFVCVAALSFLTYAPASADHRGDNHSATAHGAGIEPAVNTSPSQFLPASGDVLPNSMSRSNEHDALRRNMQASRRFQGGDYIAPQGYQYRHWSYGDRLPRLYYARDYWIGNVAMLGLSAAPSDLVWVRVGDDALLIDRTTRDIVQVYYSVFY